MAKTDTWILDTAACWPAPLDVLLTCLPQQILGCAEDTIITWTDTDIGVDVALSFQEVGGCTQVWYRPYEGISSWNVALFTLICQDWVLEFARLGPLQTCKAQAGCAS